MTIIASPGTASCGGGARSTLLVSPKKRELKTYQSRRRSLGGCLGRAAASRSQEGAANPELLDGPCQALEVVVVDVALPPPMVQEPAKPKRGGPDASGVEISWAAKKKRSAVAGASERSSAIVEVSGAAAAFVSSSTSIVEEMAGILSSPETICKKDRRLSGGVGAFTVDRKDEKLRPCTFASPAPAPHGVRQDSEASWLIKKSCPDTVVVCKGDSGAVGQGSMAGPSTPPLRIQESISTILPVRKAQAAARQRHKTTKHCDCKMTTSKQLSMSLRSRLQCLGVTNVTTVLAKVLTSTDCSLSQSRLLLPSYVVESPLMTMLTPFEDRAVHRVDKWDGLPLEALDQHGRSYYMTFKFLESNGAYRLIGEWGKFLAQNGVCCGDLFELGAFRFEGQLVLTLMHRAKEDQTHELTEAAKNSEEVHIAKEMEENEGAVEEGTSEEIEAAMGAEKWTHEEMEAVAIMMELSNFKNGESHRVEECFAKTEAD
ncbi:hypothetical protein PR202_gb24529 [Eleusine coracana subsp. coracana]|uniref:TF-B3 domain-containing protein n=1 Tax=Eleusine coracana subsp. coracana TaxID=191504 RepID=A0AAV5FL89_ELECO|nr:hypothetical protein QOZ80_5BG0449460 [Eleusine coracana subsp. coracana]GJN35726.1 hypothetical protein PR202_gb24529 [Eleusine coracana subsp. coracana]